MDEICSDEREQFSLKITDFISHELKLPSENVTPDLIINKGQHMLDSEQIHMILARIADDTGISMTLLRRVFPYDRYFITWKSAGLVMMGIAIFVLAIITFFIGEGTGMGFFVLPLFFLIEAIAFIKYIKTFFIRRGNPGLTIKLFIEIILLIINKHRNELACDVQPQERQLWRKKIYEVCYRYKNIFWSDNEFLPALIVPLSDPDEFDLPPLVEECAEVMSLSFEIIDQSGIYDKYIEYDEDELLTIVHFADLLIDFWAENQIKLQNKNTPTSGLKLNIIDKIRYHE